MCSHKIRCKASMSILTTSVQRFARSPSQCNKTRKRNEAFKLEREEIKLSLFTDDFIVYIENPMIGTKSF